MASTALRSARHVSRRCGKEANLLASKDMIGEHVRKLFEHREEDLLLALHCNLIRMYNAATGPR